jgi:hypothetical protein
MRRITSESPRSFALASRGADLGETSHARVGLALLERWSVGPYGQRSYDLSPSHRRRDQARGRPKVSPASTWRG